MRCHLTETVQLSSLSSNTSFDKRTSSPNLEPFPTYEESVLEPSPSDLPEINDFDRSLIPSPLKPRLKSTTSCDLSEKRISQAYVDAPPKRALKLPAGHQPLRLTVEEQKYSREPLQTFVRQRHRIAREFARNRARERANTTIGSVYPPRPFDPTFVQSPIFREPSRNPFHTELSGFLASPSSLPQSSDLPIRNPNVTGQAHSSPPDVTFPVDHRSLRYPAPRRTLHPESSSSSKKQATRRATGPRQPTVALPVTPPYPPHFFETRSERRRFDPLNFFPVPVDSDANTYVSPTPARIVGRSLSRPREVSAPSAVTPSLQKESSGGPDSNVDSNKSKRRSRGRKRGSSGLASTLRRLFRSSSKRSSEEEEIGTSLADIDSFLSPQGSTPQQTAAPNFSQNVSSFAAERGQRSTLPDFDFPFHTPGTEIHSSAIGIPVHHPRPTVSANIPALTRAVPISPTPVPRNLPAFPVLSVPSASFNMDSSRLSRTSRLLDPAMVAITKQKAEAMKLAREQAAAVQEMCRRAKTDVPPYEFEELIGKGAYGRVYKGRQLPSRQVVAIKVMDIDTLDYKSIRDMKDESIKDFIHETKVMKQVKDAGAKNINMLIEAISIHSQLWLVCEYCPGGSVKTLVSSV